MRGPRRRLLVAATTSMTICALAMPISSAVAQERVNFENVWMVNANSGKCLAIGSTYRPAPAFQYDCTSRFIDQRWGYNWGYANLTNYFSGMDLSIVGFPNPFVGQQRAPYGTSYDLYHAGNGLYLVRNRGTGRCLVVQGRANGSRLFEYTCAGQYRDQLWRFVRPGTSLPPA